MTTPAADSFSPQIPSQPPRGIPRRWLWLLPAAALTVALGIWFLLSHEKASPATTPSMQTEGQSIVLKDGAPQWSYVKLATAEKAAPLPLLPAPGRVVFDVLRTASVGAPMLGRVEEMHVRPGNSVKKGDKLFSVRSREYADLDKELASARETVNVKRRVRDRAQELLALSAIPEKDLISANAELKEAELQLKAAEAKKRSLGVLSESENLFWVRAPRDGIVVALDVFESQEVSPERSEPLVRISDLAEVEIQADVPELDARSLREGSQALIRTREGLERIGVLHHIARIVDPQRQTVTLRVKADNPDFALKPNAFVEVTVSPAGQADIVQIADDAVVSDGTQSVVFVVKDSQHLVKTPVLPGRRANGKVEILSGLSAGTQYVSRGALLLLNQLELAD